ncbi:pentapeptide repeat-containing protein [Tenacibaculum sp. IB213877]|uniref:pentapeptide repeat-containing protein n=1 Tax=Tenacibaculum sp. IB213877 TaxID=3097351 RepID=UPI002A5AFA1D|nr:pentapeptide repeat-containing protein [Tenacibaculum sp. IB213877]MDY0779248.1 pentapeptide repeat-containing protein [Tenacibaculum sp. IB213877]
MKKIITTLAFCILVATSFAQKSVNASDLLRDIKAGKDVVINNAVIDGILDLTYMDEALPKLPKRKKWWNNGGSNTVEKQITGKVVFTNCTFNDDVLAYIPDESSGYTFVANFEDEVAFKDCTFERKAMFKYSHFERDADFSGTKFQDDNTFKYAKFEKNSSFKNTFFDEPATFKYAEFSHFVSFASSIFKDTAIFKYTEFKDGVSFNNTKFEEDLNIKYTKVRGEFDITNMEVAYDIDSKYTEINGKSFSNYLLKSRK